jgi:RNA polymerase sigma-54 factor
MYQRQFQKIQHQTTAHLAQTMKLLKLNNDELEQEIERILNENPALEVNPERRCPQCKRKLLSDQICPVCSRPKNNDSEEAIVFLSQSSDFNKYTNKHSEDSFTDNEFSSQSQNLSEYVLRQIVFDLEEEDRKIAAYLINLFNEDGFIEEEEISTAQYFHVSLQRIKDIKIIIKHADPIGVGSSSPKEAMITQLEVLNENQEIPGFFKEIIQDNLELLSKKNFEAISKKLDIPIEEIKQAADFIGENLNPFPARAYWGSTRNPTDDVPEVFGKPDAIIQQMNNDPNKPLLVEVILPYIGSLEINSLYRQAIQEANLQKKGELKTVLDNANLFIKCLQQRNNTMQRLMEKITNYQRTFILNGEKYLYPMTRAELAKELDVHESTISRAVANKSIQMPDGRIIPLAKFFDRSLGVRFVMKNIIENEKESNPLSDTKIKEILEEKGYKVARRTVAKYRAMEGILPAYLRKNKEA